MNSQIISKRTLLWLALTLLTPFWWSELAFGSALSDLATSMQPGTWAPLATNGFNSGAVLRPPSTGSSLEYTDKAGAWNPVNRTILVLGGAHPNSTPLLGTLSTTFAGYTESTNSWGNTLPNPTPTYDTAFLDGFGGGGIGHGYHHNTINPTTGDFYHRQYGFGKVMKFSNATQSWSQCSVFNPGGAYQVAGALEYFPDRNSLVYLDGDWGVWELSLASGNCTGTWTQVASTIGGGFSPQLTGLYSYHNQSRYSPRCQCIIMGGGNGSKKLYRYNANGTFSAIADAPVAISIPQAGSGTIFTVDPVTGYILVWDFASAATTMYQYDPVTDSWTTIGRNSPIFPSIDAGVNETVAIPISTYGVIMFVQAGSSLGGSVYLYRHAAGSAPIPPASDTVAPSIPSGVSAVAVSSSQINISWAASTDNVGVQGYKIYRSGAQIGSATQSSYSDTNLSPSTSYAYTIAAYDAVGNTSVQSAPSSATTQSASLSALTPSGSSDFQARCSAPGVVRCFGFDTGADLGFSGWGGNFGFFNNIGPCASLPSTASCPVIDNTIAASGSGSIKFTIHNGGNSSTAGQWYGNFSTDNSVKFGAGDTLYIQWRQRFSPEMAFNFQDAGGGDVQWKQAIIAAGDNAGCSTRDTTNCSGAGGANELVPHTKQRYFFPVMYNSQTGSTHVTPFADFEEPLPPYDFKLQNARPSPYCLYSQKFTNPITLFPPSGNCIPYVPNEWMTFQIGVTIGPLVGDEYAASRVRLWVARDGQPSQLVIDWNDKYLAAGTDPNFQKWGKIWLVPHMTNKNPNQTHPDAYTWYDELIISRNQIADPSSSGAGTVQAPVAPSSVTINK